MEADLIVIAYGAAISQAPRDVYQQAYEYGRRRSCIMRRPKCPCPPSQELCSPLTNLLNAMGAAAHPKSAACSKRLASLWVVSMMGDACPKVLLMKALGACVGRPRLRLIK